MPLTETTVLAHCDLCGRHERVPHVSENGGPVGWAWLKYVNGFDVTAALTGAHPALCPECVGALVDAAVTGAPLAPSCKVGR